MVDCRIFRHSRKLDLQRSSCRSVARCISYSETMEVVDRETTTTLVRRQRIETWLYALCRQLPKNEFSPFFACKVRAKCFVGDFGEFRSLEIRVRPLMMCYVNSENFARASASFVRILSRGKVLDGTQEHSQGRDEAFPRTSKFDIDVGRWL